MYQMGQWERPFTGTENILSNTYGMTAHLPLESHDHSLPNFHGTVVGYTPENSRVLRPV